MKKIQIINGTYGYRPKGSKYVDPKKAGSPPFPVEDAEAERLIGLGVAQYPQVVTDDSTGAAATSGQERKRGTGGGTNTPEKNGEHDGEEGGQAIPEYNKDTDIKELRDLMKKAGINSFGMSKPKMADALDKYFYGDPKEEEREEEEGESDDETPPNLSPADPE